MDNNVQTELFDSEETEKSLPKRRVTVKRKVSVVAKVKKLPSNAESETQLNEASENAEDNISEDTQLKTVEESGAVKTHKRTVRTVKAVKKAVKKTVRRSKTKKEDSAPEDEVSTNENTDDGATSVMGDNASLDSTSSDSASSESTPSVDASGENVLVKSDAENDGVTEDSANSAVEGEVSNSETDSTSASSTTDATSDGGDAEKSGSEVESTAEGEEKSTETGEKGSDGTDKGVEGSEKEGEKTEEESEEKPSYQGKHQNKKQKGKPQFNGAPKKIYTMEEICITEEEYKQHLNNRLVVNELVLRSVYDLKKILSEITGKDVEEFAELKKQEIVASILREHCKNEGVIYSKGTLEILPDGYGFLRSSINSYLSGSEDVYLPSGLIKFLNLKTGDTIEGLIRPPKDNERFFALSRVAFVNDDLPIVAKTRASFDSLIPLYPNKRINLETPREDKDVSMRIINLFCPIGKGQRALITAPPRTGKTILLQQIANAITQNHPEINLIVLLVDERPEEVTDMRRNVKGEVIASTFDEQATRHVQVAEMVIEKAKRLVEHKRDVVILLDSITRLARAYNQTVPASGKILSGGVDSNALHKPKRFFGAARNIEGGGSLTIIASALIETGSRMDEVIFEEFKGTGNSEIVLDRMMAERRLFPAINIKKSGTRREDLLLEPDEANRIWILRNNVLSGLEDYDITRLLVDKMQKTKNNEAFLRSMNMGAIPIS